MLRTLIILFFYFITTLLLGQEENKIDSLGLKQGYWIITGNKLLPYSANHSESEGWCQHQSPAFSVIKKSEGNYKNNNKIGTWLYYNSISDSSGLELKEIYKDDEILIENFIENYTLVVSKDSNVIYGEVYNSVDSLKIVCNNKSCSILNSKDILVLKSNSNIDEMYLTLSRLNFGMYKREIIKSIK